ncbi:MAG: hypothetical protein J6X16_06270 [Bacteroidales bacterium]|nr:hypothetical protein [Bacteroidales bacterium]
MKHALTYRPNFTSTNIGGYRYFFNGQEGDNEVFGETANYAAEFWQYDSRLGRRWNLDWIYKPFASNYAAFANNPIWYADPSGLDTISMNKHGDIIDRVKTSCEEHVIKLEAIEVTLSSGESSGGTARNSDFQFPKNPYRPGSIPYFVVNENKDNPNLWYQKSSFQWSNTTKSQWMRDFDRTFGTMLLAGMTPAFAPIAEPLIAEVVTSFPEFAGIAAQGTRHGFLLAKQGVRFSLTRGYGFYIKVTTDEVFLTNINFANYVMNIPMVQFGSGVFIGTGIELKYIDLPPDFSTGYFFFDYGLQTGTLFGKSIKELRK